MPYGLSAANSPTSSLFPPQQRKAFHKAVLDEILEERVVSSRGRQIPRGVKRKMSKCPLRPRHVSATDPIVYKKCVNVLQCTVLYLREQTGERSPSRIKALGHER